MSNWDKHGWAHIHPTYGQAQARGPVKSLVFQTTPNASAGLYTRMVVRESGKVGINSTAPVYELDVAGDVRAGASSSQGLILVSPDGTKFRVTVSNAGALSASAV